MSLVDAQGRPVQRPALTDQQLMSALQNLDQRITYVGQTQVEHGLILEYIVQKLSEEDENGNSVLNLDLAEEFQEFAQNRMKEIRKDIEDIKTAVQQRRGVNLDETDITGS